MLQAPGSFGLGLAEDVGARRSLLVVASIVSLGTAVVAVAMLTVFVRAGRTAWRRWRRTRAFRS